MCHICNYNLYAIYLQSNINTFIYQIKTDSYYKFTFRIRHVFVEKHYTLYI